jgi:pimeloyl-ACP methyl ester carboxylesterase
MESKFVQAGSVKLQYFEEGDGPETIVLVHGYASSAVLWRYTIDHLARERQDGSARYRILAFNNRGAGESGRAESEDGYTVQSYAVDLHNAVSALGLDDFILVGHSMGGATVTQFAMAHQDMLRALVLLNSAPLNGRVLPGDWEDALRASFAEGGLTQGDMGFQAPHITPDFIEEVRSIILRNPIERAIGGRRSMAALRLRDRLGEIRVPTMVVGGDTDTTVGVDNIVAEYLALPPDNRHLHIFHGIGHSPNVEVPARLSGLLTRFAGEVSQRESAVAV